MRWRLNFLFTFTPGHIKHHSFHCHINGLSLLRQKKRRNEDISSIPDIDQRRPEAEQNAYLTSVVAPQLLLGEEADGATGRL